MSSVLPVLVLLVLILPRDAAAYIDPGAGSMIVQMLLGGVAGLLVVGKLYYRRLLAFFGRRETPPERQAGPER
jgi:hypothetical protein